MKSLSPRNLDRAVERRWPQLFRFDLRQALWSAIALQVAAMLFIIFGASDDASSAGLPAGPLLVGSVSLLGRVLWECRSKKPPARS